MLPSTFLKVVWMAGLGWCADLRWSHLPSLLASIDKLDAINLTSSSTPTAAVSETTVRPVRISPSAVTAPSGRPKAQLRRSRMEPGSRPFRGTARFTMSTPGWEGPTRRPSLYQEPSYPLVVAPGDRALYPAPPSRYAGQATPQDPHLYSFSYDAGDHSRQESSDGYRVVGSWSYVDPEDGVLRRVTYEAGPDTGFVAHIEPVMEPLPILVPSGLPSYPSSVRPYPSASIYPSSPRPSPSSARPYGEKHYPSTVRPFLAETPYPSSTVRPYPGEKNYPSGPYSYSTVRPLPAEKHYPSSPYPSSTVRPYPSSSGTYPSSTVRPFSAEKPYPPSPYPSSTVRPYPSSPGPYPSSTVRPYPSSPGPYPSSTVRPYPSSPGPYPSSTIRPYPSSPDPYPGSLPSSLHPHPPRPTTGSGSRRVLPPLFIPTGEDFSNGYYFDSGLGSPQWGDRIKPRVTPSDPAPPAWSSPVPEVQYRRSTTASPADVSRLLSQAVLGRSLNSNIQAKHNYAILNEITNR